MIIPEGVVISGNVASSSEAEIGGRIDGDVEVKGHLTLESTALVSGNVRAHSCRIEGLVEGRVECVEELDLGPTGRLNAAAASNKRVNVEGQVSGDISSAGLVRVASSAQVTGDISARSLVLEEGGTFNGTCSMQTPSQKEQ
jgi:cytoskeletal protein CcmA (bactofilin family)